MITFVNAKINIGLFVTHRRPDGYHDLETVFYPVGLHNGTPANPSPFCDIIEVVPCDLKDKSSFAGTRYSKFGLDYFIFSGRRIECPLEKNLVCRAVKAYRENCEAEGYKSLPSLTISLNKHLPDGAGLGGGSADASFVLRMLDSLSLKLHGEKLGQKKLADVALSLGADCPFFIFNRPSFASGVGEKLIPVDDILKDKWLVIAKPDVYVSTREAFAGLKASPAPINLREIVSLPVGKWRDIVSNDFEKTIFALFPEVSHLKDKIYELGAEYASMSGSGSSVYGIFDTANMAIEANRILESTTMGSWLLKL